jgi:hypothetical protein
VLWLRNFWKLRVQDSRAREKCERSEGVQGFQCSAAYHPELS